jgi:hypothetical protein
VRGHTGASLADDAYDRYTNFNIESPLYGVRSYYPTPSASHDSGGAEIGHGHDGGMNWPFSRRQSANPVPDEALLPCEATSGRLEQQARLSARVHLDEEPAHGSGEGSSSRSEELQALAVPPTTAELNGLMWSEDTPTPERYHAMSLLCDKRERVMGMLRAAEGSSGVSSPERASAHVTAPTSASVSAARTPTRVPLATTVHTKVENCARAIARAEAS